MNLFEALDNALEKFTGKNDPNWDLKVVGYVLTYVPAREIQEYTGDDSLFDLVYEYQREERF